MAKQAWKGGNMLYPLPAVMVSCASEAGERDIVTVAWAGTVCTNPPMLSISLRPERHSYHIVRESGEFVVNLVTARLQRACDWCGVRSGRDFDKWAECGLTPAPAATLGLAPAIEESPVSIECRVHDVLELGSHHLFLADVTAVQVEEGLLARASPRTATASTSSWGGASGPSGTPSARTGLGRLPAAGAAGVALGRLGRARVLD